MDEDSNIWIAASDGKLEEVQAYVAAGVDVNAQDETGYSPLHAAASYGHTEVLTWLLANGANAGLKDEDGDTPLHACESAECAALLLAAGADLTAVNGEGATPYAVSFADCREDMVDYLASVYASKGLEVPVIAREGEEDGEGAGWAEAVGGEEDGEGEGEADAVGAASGGSGADAAAI